MEDVLTNDPPPSRFFPDDLDNFSSPSPPFPLPFFHPSNPNTKNPNFLIILISPSSLSLLPSSKTLISSLSLPDLPSPPISFYLLAESSTVVAAVNRRIDPDRSKAVAKLILKEFEAERVVVLDSIRGENYRGRLSADENPMVFKLETKEERSSAGGWLEGVEWLGSGSLVEGLGAAVMGECEMRRRKAAMVVTWPEGGKAVGRVLKGIVKGLGVQIGDGVDVGGGVKSAAYWLDSGLYT